MNNYYNINNINNAPTQTIRTYQVVTPASTYPVSLTEAKAHLKVDINTDDTLITNLIIASTQLSEEYTNRFFINTVITQTCSTFLDLKSLLKSKVINVSFIKYYDSDNTLQTLSPSNYVVNNQFEPCQINPVIDFSYPDIAKRIDAIQCKYNVGYGTAAADVPNAIKQAILLTIGNWYANRETVIIGRITSKLPQSALWLLNTYKVQVV